jgi:hypothetical protein
VVGFLEGPELLIVFFILLGLVPLALGIWALVDAASKPDWAWQQVGSSKVLYIVLIAVGFVVCGLVSLVASIVYLVSVRPRLAQATATGLPQGPHPPAYGPSPQFAVGPPAPGWWLASDGRWYPPPSPYQQPSPGAR